MKHTFVAGLAFIVLAATSSRVLSAQQRVDSLQPLDLLTQRTRGSGTSTIVGRVFDASTNAPIRRAQVHATNKAMLVDAITDDDGRFQLANLPAGQWLVSVSKGGYFTWQIGQRRPFEETPPVSLARGQRLTADVPLSRGGVITGRVAEENGEPLAGLRVRVYRSRMSQGYRRLEAVASADQTDDTGAYRIYGLPPGDYYVAASLRMAPPDSLIETTYSPTYYPGTGDLSEAQRIRVGLGTETTASFPLLPIRQVRVTGTVVSSSGGPANAFLNLVSESAELGVPLGIGGVTQDDGTFTLPDVPPGRYTLNASLRGDGPSESASVPLTVGTDDVSGTTLVTARAATMKGRFVVDAGVSRAVPTGLDIVAVAARPGGTVLSSGSGTAFELGELVEPFTVRVDGLPEGWGVKEIVVNGIDVTDTKISLPLNQEAEARIVITDRVTHVNGTVSAGGKPSKAQIVIFPEDTTKWTYPSRRVRTTSADNQGRFRISGLPAERYLAIAADYLEEGEYYDPDFLSRVREQAAPLTLAEAETRAVDLTVIER